MLETMMRGRSQIIWRYTPASLFKYNESGGWCATRSVTLKDTRPLEGSLARAIAAALTRWNAINPTDYPDPISQSNKYIVGEPFGVWYEIWPLVFTCRKCGRLHFYKELDKLRQINPRLGCMSCRGRDELRQVPYAYVCECGKLETVYAPKHDSKHIITLVNKGNFQESYWKCSTCRIPLYKNPREGLGFRPCDCKPKKFKRGIVLEDSRIYYSQTVDLVDIEPKILDRWRDNGRFPDLLIAAAISINAYRSSHILDLAKWKSSDGGLTPELQAMKQLLLNSGQSEAAVDELIKAAAASAGGDPWLSYDRELSVQKTLLPSIDWKESRQTVEFVFVRDEPSCGGISLQELITEAENFQDPVTATRYRTEDQLALDLGLTKLRVLESLPIMLAGIGYTRYWSAPQDAADVENNSLKLKPYALENNKIPIFAARNTTEALMFELDPCRLAAFLTFNCEIKLPTEISSIPSLKSWILRQVQRLLSSSESHLALTDFELEVGSKVEEISALAFGLIHSISHVLKATAHKYVGIDADSISEYLFPAHSCAILYASSHVQFTLGGIDAVFRSNLSQWLGSARDYAGQCSFDPVCSSLKGACLACLYSKFGCSYFNRSLSRSYLLGGKLEGRKEPIIGFWTPEVVSETNRIRSRVGAVPELLK